MYHYLRPSVLTLAQMELHRNVHTLRWCGSSLAPVLQFSYHWFMYISFTEITTIHTRDWHTWKGTLSGSLETTQHHIIPMLLRYTQLDYCYTNGLLPYLTLIKRLGAHETSHSRYANARSSDNSRKRLINAIMTSYRGPGGKALDSWPLGLGFNSGLCWYVCNHASFMSRWLNLVKCRLRLCTNIT
jgi:hypothetical protein